MAELQNTKSSVTAGRTQSKEELASAATGVAEIAKVTRSWHQSRDWRLRTWMSAGEVEALNNKVEPDGANHSL